MSAISFNSNLASMRANRQVSLSTGALQQSYERLSTGLRINRAVDDAAGLAIAENLRVDQRLFNQARRNVNDGLSLLNVAESALDEQGSILVRLQELAEQAANGTLSNQQRYTLDREYQSLLAEFGRVAASTSFNGLKPLSGSQGGAGGITLQVGIDGSANSRIGLAPFNTGRLSGVLNWAENASQLLDQDGGLEEFILSETFTIAEDHPTLADQELFDIIFPNAAQISVTDSSGTTRQLLLAFAEADDSAVQIFLFEKKADNRISSVTGDNGIRGPDILLEPVGGTLASGQLVSRDVNITFEDGTRSSFFLDVSGLSMTGTVGPVTFGSGASTPTTAIDFTQIASVSRAKHSLKVLEARANELTSYRGDFGAAANRLNAAASLLAVNEEGAAAAESQIRSVDISAEASRLVAAQIRQRAAAAVLSQANQGPALLLSLLQGAR